MSSLNSLKHVVGAGLRGSCRSSSMLEQAGIPSMRIVGLSDPLMRAL